jgi:hypothetical protein
MDAPPFVGTIATQRLFLTNDAVSIAIILLTIVLVIGIARIRRR